MEVNVTDSMDLMLTWDRDCFFNLNFSLAWEAEFTIHGKVEAPAQPNYQESLKCTFATMCYGYDLAQLCSELEQVERGTAGSAIFVNTGGDLEVEFSATRCLICYKHLVRIEPELSHAELIVPLEGCRDLGTVRRTVAELLHLLKVDCRYCAS